MNKKVKRYSFSDEDGGEVDVSIFEIEHDPDEDRLPPWCKSLDVTTIESRLLELEEENKQLKKEKDYLERQNKGVQSQYNESWNLITSLRQKNFSFVAQMKIAKSDIRVAMGGFSMGDSLFNCLESVADGIDNVLLSSVQEGDSDA
jgi:hypothetical protein